MLRSLEGSRSLTMSLVVKEPEQGDRKCELSKPWMGARQRMLPKGALTVPGPRIPPGDREAGLSSALQGPANPFSP